MLFDRGREKTIDNHKALYQTYKNLKEILPYSFIKNPVPKGQKFFLKRKPIIRQIERDRVKNNSTTPSKIKDLIFTKNIFLYTSEIGNSKKLITKIKKLYPKPLKKSHKIISLNNDNNDIFNNSKEKNNSKISNKTNYTNILNNYLIISNKLKLNKEDEINLDTNIGTKSFKTTTIYNCLKNNIYLPSLSDRMKDNIPRFKRQKKGFLIQGIGKDSFHSNNAYIKTKEPLLRKERKSFESIKINKINKTTFYENMNFLSSDKDKKINLNNNDMFNNKIKKILMKNNLNKNEDVKITDIRKVEKNK